MNIKDRAKKTESLKTLNIADLDKVSTELELLERTGNTLDGEEFSYFAITIDKKDYRVPKSVLLQLKTILEHNPDLKFFKVIKTGSGLNTDYQVLAL